MIHEELENAEGNQVPSKRMICMWIKAFEEDRETFEDEPRSGRPREAVACSIFFFFFFFAVDGVNSRTVVPKPRTVTGEYYANTVLPNVF
jgi:hypothetical protein